MRAAWRNCRTASVSLLAVAAAAGCDAGSRSIVAEPPDAACAAAVCVGAATELQGDRSEGGFGRALALDGDVLLAGDPTGATYAFHRTDDGWAGDGVLAAPAGEDATDFGRFVAVAGDRALVAAAHAAYLYQRSDAGWREQRRLPSIGPGYGIVSAALAGDVAVIGWRRGDGVACEHRVQTLVREGEAWRHDTLQTLDSGERACLQGPAALDATGERAAFTAADGTVTVVSRAGAKWQTDARLRPSGGPYVHASVAIDGDRVVVGLPWHLDRHAGSAAVFRRDPGGWREDALLVPDDSIALDGFGWTVRLRGDTLAVASPSYQTEPARPGRVHLYLASGAQWDEVAVVLPASGAAGFGGALALSERWLAVQERGGIVSVHALTGTGD